ncbi:MAG: hypothetical protein EOP38_09635 [Rubrivivax sp.]|nr:MAG: hypothetical protein EOP38_09635 [Rubrivivax sp.]
MINSSESQSATQASQKDLARIAASILFALAASVWLINEGDVRVSLLRWLTIVLALGLILNTQKGLSIRTLMLGALGCATTLIVGASFLSYMICRQGNVISPPLLSGSNLCKASVWFSGGLMLFVLFSSAIAVLLAAMSRQLVIEALEGIPIFAAKAKKIENNIRVLSVSFAAILVLLKLLAYL